MREVIICLVRIGDTQLQRIQIVDTIVDHAVRDFYEVDQEVEQGKPEYVFYHVQRK